ncbi:MAG: transglycosylase domain-containing protein [Bacteroidales bacterium]|nr:transglycosylase domain-containing protein [Bacteroidales bacterium]
MGTDKKSKKKYTWADFKKPLKWFWGLFLFGTICIVVFFILLSNGLIGYMPTFEDLENPNNSLATDIISEDGKTLGKLYIENRSQVDFEEISPYVVRALVDTEDERFFDHSGIDSKGLFRVLIKTVVMRDESSGGGSTITQQLAKMLFHGHADTKWERYTQKLKEWVIAVKLERSYTKEEIISMYLNRVSFLYDAYGVESASWTYFGVSVKDLKIEQAAVLVGMLKNPALYNPVRRPDLVRDRRNVVFGQMLKQRDITTAQFDSLKQLPLELKFTRSDHKDGDAPYFREYVRLMLTAKKPVKSDYASWQEQKYIEDSIQWCINPAYGWIEKNPKSDGTKYNIYRDGLRIHTTLDSRMQRYAEEAVIEHVGHYLQPEFFRQKKNAKRAPYTSNTTQEQFEELINKALRNSDRFRALKKSGWDDDKIMASMKDSVETKAFTYAGEVDTIMTPYDSVVYHKHFLRSSLMSINPKNGHIKAYVGGVNFKYFMYDMVSLGKRQVGSTIKPFVYAFAMKEGHTPCDLVPNSPQTFLLPDGKTWTPKDDGKVHVGDMMSLKWGLANSNNNITAWVMKQYSPEHIAKMIGDMGIRSHIEPVYSMFLGTSEITLSEMVEAYGAFVNKGVHISPMAITHIEDHYGNVIATFAPHEFEPIDEQTAYLMVNMLQGVCNGGTGARLRGTDLLGNRYGFVADDGTPSEMGGKTGTTQNQSDGWFMSILPNLVTGVWVGGEERDIHFNDMTFGQGSRMALPVFGNYLRKIYNDKSITEVTRNDKFEKPAKVTFSLNCPDEGETESSESSGSSIFNF